MKWSVSAAAVLGFILLVASAGSAVAQQQTVEIRTGTVLWVEGNTLVVEGPMGVREVEVADDFRFDMGDKQLSVHDLEPGMKITALITTTKTPVQLTSVEVRQAEVLRKESNTLIVRFDDGTINRYWLKELRDLKITLSKDGKEITGWDLKEGDVVAATFISEQPPTTITSQELQAYVQKPPPPRRQAPPPPKPAPVVAQLPKTASPLPLIGLGGLFALGVGVGLTALRRRNGR